MKTITSRDNPRLKALRRLAQDNTAYRRTGQVWVEGEHLCDAALARAQTPVQVVVAQSRWDDLQHRPGWSGLEVLVLPDALMASLSSLGSPSAVAMVLKLPPQPELDHSAPTVILDRLQDAGNVGSILRSAAAFGFGQVLALRGTAALWGDKVVRAAMGAHFSLRLLEQVDPGEVAQMRVPVLATSSHGGAWLHQTRLPMPCAWVFGHEGQGVDPALMQRAGQLIRIAQPGGEESLNVAAAAAICLHACANGAAGRAG